LYRTISFWNNFAPFAASKLVNEMQTMRVEMTAMRQQMNRLERIEKRLELAD
jgi:hypothetical protein